jgi:hypothetical protein
MSNAWLQKIVQTNPRFSFITPLPPTPALAIFMGMCIRVISPTPSKNLRIDSGVVLNDRFPTQTEFWRFGTFDGASSAVFFTFSFLSFGGLSVASATSFFAWDFFCFFFCRLCSA